MDIFTDYPEYEFEPFMDKLYTSVVQRPLDALLSEGAHNSSAVLDLFIAWSGELGQQSLLYGMDNTILSRVFALVGVDNVAPAVVENVLKIADNLLPTTIDLGFNKKGDAMDLDIKATIADELHVHLAILIDGLTKLLLTTGADGVEKKAKENPFSSLQLSILSRLTSFASDADTSQKLVELLLPFLAKPSAQVADRDKRLILDIVARCINTFGGHKSHFGTLARYFAVFRHIATRDCLCHVFQAYASEGSEADKTVSRLVSDLNSIDTKSIDDVPDFDTRLEAFREFNETIHASLDFTMLVPITHNLMFFCASEELSIRNSASHAVILLLKRVADSTSTLEEKVKVKADRLLMRVIFPAIKKGMKEKNLEGRHEYIGLLENIVQLFPTYARFSDLVHLASEDDEIDFFKNIRHIQLHRRMKALVR